MRLGTQKRLNMCLLVKGLFFENSPKERMAQVCFPEVVHRT